MLYKYKDDLKFVYNFHSFGPMYIWPYNGEIDNELDISNPEAKRIFNEIWDGAKFPTTTLHGNAIKTVGYVADGEANDYILKKFDIPSVSPELASDNFFSSDFFLPYDFVTREVLRDNHPWIHYTIQKLAGEVSFGKNTTVTLLPNGNYQFSFRVRNSGLQNWNLHDENRHISFEESGQVVSVPLPNLEARQSSMINVEVPAAKANWVNGKLSLQV